MTTSTFAASFIERVQNLYSRGFLPKYFKSPIFGLWELTNRCNLYCIHCYYNANSSSEAELSTDEALNVARQLGELKVFEVYLSGGEPFLREDWELIIRSLRKNDIEVGIITNGTQLTKDVASTLAKLGVKWVQVSIDGSTPDLHDRVRGLKGGWARSVRGIQYLLSEGVRTHISFVPSNINYYDVGNVIELCVKLGITYFVTDMLVLTGKAAMNFSSIMLSSEQYKEFFNLLESSANKFGDKITIIAPSQEKEALRTYITMRSSTPNIWCIITPQGRLRLDLLLPFTYGDLRKQTIHQVWSRYLKDGWHRPEVESFISRYEYMSDLVKEDNIPYVGPDFHCE